MTAANGKLAIRPDHKLLGSSVRVLDGVTPQGARTLKLLGIESVLDLASSRIFQNADAVVQASREPSVYRDVGDYPTDWLDRSRPRGPIESQHAADIETLHGVGRASGRLLRAALGVRTISDLAGWLPYRVARSAFDRELAAAAIRRPDPEVPTELVPTMGRYPVERIHYSALILDGFGVGPAGDASEGHAAQPQWKHLATATPAKNKGTYFLSLPHGDSKGAPMVVMQNAPKQAPSGLPIGLGAIVRFEQSWYPHKVDFGTLLHSIALAPGEHTNIAVIDWERRVAAQRSDATDISERLSATITRDRSLSEVADIVAREVQQGMSSSENTSQASATAESSALGSGSGAAFTFPGGVGVAGLGFGWSDQSNEATTEDIGWVTASSEGERTLGASLTQTITDKTHQTASSVRSQRSTVIVETHESERETLRTRTIRNYNHMHALTLEYWEVVQVYRTETRVKTATPAILVPMDLVVSWDSSTIRQNQRAIAHFALDKRVTEVLQLSGERVRLNPAAAELSQPSGVDGLLRDMRLATGLEVAPAGSPIWTVPPGVHLQSVSLTRVDGFEIDGRIAIELVSGAVESIDLRNGSAALPTSRSLSDVVRVRFIGKVRENNNGIYGYLSGRNVEVTVRLHLEYRDTNLKYQLDWKTKQHKTSDPDVELPLVQFDKVVEDVEGWSWLQSHLQANTTYYSRVVWRTLDPYQRLLALARFPFADSTLMQWADPVPYGYSGPYMVLRLRPGLDQAARSAWTAWCKLHGLTSETVSTDFIPMQTGGIFAEAVQGRANSAERLDITRFWNWQDSPIPDDAPTIAPLDAGSRAQAIPLTPTPVVAPLVSLQASPDLPQPGALAATLAQVGAAATFRDMSGAAGLMGLAGQALTVASNLASQAGAQAQGNLARALETSEKMATQAANIFSAQAARPNDAPQSGSKPSTGEMSPTTFGAVGNRLAELEQTDASSAQTGRSADNTARGGQANRASGPTRTEVAGSDGGQVMPSQADLYRTSFGQGRTTTASSTAAMPSEVSPASVSASVRDKLVSSAQIEFVNAWQSGVLNEDSAGGRQLLLGYYQDGLRLGFEAVARIHYDQLQSSPAVLASRSAAVQTIAAKPYANLTVAEKETLLSALPWSSVFITALMKRAGVAAFPDAWKHPDYVEFGQDNEQAATGLIRAYKVDVERPRVGDVVVHSTDGLATWDIYKGNSNTHGDIVIALSGQRMWVIGGNLSNSVQMRDYALTAAGLIDPASNHFAIVRIVD